MIPIFDPWISADDAEAVFDCVKSGWVSSVGPRIEEFERLIEASVEAPFAISMSNGTSALHAALMALDLPSGSEVLVPAHSFIAPVNACLLAGLTPVLVDISEENLGIDLNLMEEKISKRTRAVIIVHQFGCGVDMQGVSRLAGEHDLKVIEDTAEAIGAIQRGRYLGTFGDIGTFSFFGNKVFTTGEGGACVTSDPLLAERLRLIRSHGMKPDGAYKHERLAHNFRLTNMQASLGCSQFARFDKILEKRSQILGCYKQFLSRDWHDGFRLLEGSRELGFVNWMITILLDPSIDRKKLMLGFRESGIETRILVPPIYHALHLKHLGGAAEFGVSEKISATGLHLPSGYSLADLDIKNITSTLIRLISE